MRRFLNPIPGTESANHGTRLTFALLLLALTLPAVGRAADPTAWNCRSLDVGYGPYDYTNANHRAEKLPIVEQAHFTTEVENLVRGKSGAGVLGDIEYTIERFPNHHRALYAMARYWLEQGRRPPIGDVHSPECWFERAIRFQPEDGASRMIYGIYLSQKGDLDAALQRYREAEPLMPGSAEIHYNTGLLLVQMGRLDDAKASALKAYEFGHPLPGLRNKLQSKGAW